jgi:hypothetical protein
MSPGDSDFRLHGSLVDIAGGRSKASRTLNTMLDRKYRRQINRYAKIKDDLTIMALWEEDKRTGNVPGAYWAIMTHPHASEDIQGEIYGQVHMMGHDTHGDYHRDNQLLEQLKDKVTILEDVIGHERLTSLRKEKEYQKEIAELQIIEQDYVTVKAENIRLRAKLDETLAEAGDPHGFRVQIDELRQHNASLYGRIDELTSELEDREDQLVVARKTVDNLESIQEHLKAENNELRQEVVSIETALLFGLQTTCSQCEDQDTDRCPGPDLCGKTVLYVGGRQNLVPRYKQLIEKHGGKFLHHDGGIEVARANLPKLLTTADAVVCPVDCVSHDACNCVKKMCKRYQKPFVMMRSSGLTSLARGLSKVVQ